jgi:large subunit ribosomal protein L6
MRKENLKPLEREIIIPGGVEMEINGQELTLKKGNKETKKGIINVSLTKKGNNLIMKTRRSTKREIKQANTARAHVKNMLNGLENNFEYRLQICSVHFPMNVSIKDNLVIIKNFLGETKERKANILPGVTVKIEKDIITIESNNKESAGQTAANIEKSARTKNKDKRIFQDGIFMTEKSGKKI